MPKVSRAIARRRKLNVKKKSDAKRLIKLKKKLLRKKLSSKDETMIGLMWKVAA